MSSNWFHLPKIIKLKFISYFRKQLLELHNYDFQLRTQAVQNHSKLQKVNPTGDAPSCANAHVKELNRKSKLIIKQVHRERYIKVIVGPKLGKAPNAHVNYGVELEYRGQLKVLPVGVLPTLVCHGIIALATSWIDVLLQLVQLAPIDCEANPSRKCHGPYESHVEHRHEGIDVDWKEETNSQQLVHQERVLQND